MQTEKIRKIRKIRKVPKSIFGVGTNDANYIVNPRIGGKSYICPYYMVWSSMLQRCYSDSYQQKQPTYIGCEVCKDWLTFSNFRTWMQEQDWEGKQLDKDILVYGNKVYSHDTCVFVTRHLNRLVSSATTLESTGIYWDTLQEKFQVRCYANGKSNFLGYFKDKEKALKAYRIFKANLIAAQVVLEDNVIIKEALQALATKLYTL